MWIRHRSNPAQFYYAPEGEGGAAGTPPPEGSGEGAAGQGEGSGTPPEGTGTEAPKLTLTQAELDAQINARLAKAQKQWQDKAEADAAAAAMTETERLKAEKDQAIKDAADKVKGANAKLVGADARVQAVAAGVKSERVALFLKNVDLSDIEVDDDGNFDEAKVKAAVQATLDLLPEFKGSTAPAGSSGGDHTGGTGKKWTREEVGKLSAEEFAKNETEIMAQMRAGTL